MNAQETANNILVDLDGESQHDLLSEAGTAPVRITPFHFNDGVDKLFLAFPLAPLFDCPLFDLIADQHSVGKHGAHDSVGIYRDVEMHLGDRV
jgi:hypothetical protein